MFIAEMRFVAYDLGRNYIICQHEKSDRELKITRNILILSQFITLIRSCEAL